MKAFPLQPFCRIKDGLQPLRDCTREQVEHIIQIVVMHLLLQQVQAGFPGFTGLFHRHVYILLGWSTLAFQRQNEQKQTLSEARQE